MNDAMKAFCITQMKKIVVAKGEEPCLADASKEEIEEALLKIAGVTVRCRKGVISGAVASVLYNLDNFRPEVRSEFESGVFELWHAEFKKSHPEKVVPEVASPEPVEVRSEAEEKPASEAVSEPAPEPEAAAEFQAERVEAKPEAAPAAKAEPESAPEPEEKDGENSDDKESSITVMAPSTEVFQKRRRDWFDLLLDASTALTSPFARKK